MPNGEATQLPVFELAKQLGWTTAELARRSGLSLATVDKVKNGSRGPGQTVIRGFRRAFPEHALDDLFGDALRPLSDEEVAA